MERTLQSYSLITSYSFYNLLSEKSDLSIGFKFNLNRFYAFERIQSVHGEASIHGSNLEIGAVYKTEFEKDKNILFGVSYSAVTKLADKIKYENENKTPIPGDSSFYTVVPEIFIARLKVPGELHFDFGIEPASNLLLSGSIVEIFWNNTSENVRNQLEFSSSAAYSFNPSLTGSIGFYYTDRYYFEDGLRLNDNMYALFLTAGLSFNINILDVDLSLADSHLYAGDFRKQTIGKISLGVQL
jgi:hypothetical protein